MITEYFLFTDRRESVRGPGGMHLRGISGLDSVQLLSHLSREDWEYPVLVVTREGGDSRWSHTVLVPRLRSKDEPNPD